MAFVRHFRWAIPLLTLGIASSIALGWLDDTWSGHDRARKQRSDLMRVFESKLDKSRNLDLYRKQQSEMELLFSVLIRQLPSKMVESGPWVASAAESSGISLIDVNREADEPHEFYASSESRIRLQGSYARFLEFVEALSTVSPECPPDTGNCGGPVHGISKVILREGREGKLRIDLTLKLFRYLDEEEFQ